MPNRSRFPVSGRVPVPDKRFDFLCDFFKPKSKVPAVLTVIICTEHCARSHIAHVCTVSNSIMLSHAHICAPVLGQVTDIAGLVKGASEGKGLGNAFLSHIAAVDGIFHLCRAFKEDTVEHVEGEVRSPLCTGLR